MRSVGLVLAGVWLWSVFSTEYQAAAEDVSLRHRTVVLTHLDYRYAVREDAAGVPRIDWSVYRTRPERVVTTQVRAVELKNQYFRATLLPAMGRLYSLVNQETDRELLYINPVAIPLGAHNDTGFWMTWGGVEHVMPRGEHGTSHALTWRWAVEENEPGRVAVRMTTVEPLTRLWHEVTYRVRAGDPFLETEITVRNLRSESVLFSHWTTATLAPGGRGEVTYRTELFVPAREYVPDDRDFNAWMKGMTGPVGTAPIRFVGEWKDIGDLMSTPLLAGYYAVFAHEVGEGLMRSFPLEATPGLDIWGWGYPASSRRQREFTRSYPSNGYIEFWNGNVKGFQDSDRVPLAGGSSLTWIERMGVFTVEPGESATGAVRELSRRMSLPATAP